MNTGAIVVAAGMSSRMGKFKPMLNIGSISIAQRVISTLQQAGADIVVVVTGYQAEQLERHLANLGVVFLRNENYERTEMFDSAKIGFDYLKDKCKKILFTPVDIPLFTSDTVVRLIQSEEPLAVPEYQGETGHPLLIHNQYVQRILDDRGEGGLQGAISRLGVPMVHVPVEDFGTLKDVDTPEEFDDLLKLHNNQLMRPIVSLSLAKEKTFLDEKMVMMLRLIEEFGSVRKACACMQISYTSGWNMVHNLESQLSCPLIIRHQGGVKGGKSRLTPEGEKIISQYQLAVKELRGCADDIYDKYFKGLFE